MIRTMAAAFRRSSDPYGIPSPGSFESTSASASLPFSAGRAMSITAVFACLRAIHQAMSVVPIHVFADDGTSRRRAPESLAWRLLHDRPHPLITAGELAGLAAGHMAGYGNAFWVKVFDTQGRVDRLFPLNPELVDVRDVGGVRGYRVRSPGATVDLTPREVLHFRGFGIDGVRGLSPIAVAHQALDAIHHEDRFRRNLLANDARVSGFLSADGEIGPEAAERLAERWRLAHAGPENAGGVAVLENGMTWQQLSMSAADLELVQQRKYSVAEVARLFGVPPSKINAEQSDSLTYATKEDESIAFVTDCLLFYARRIEQTVMLDADLFPAGQGLVAEVLLDGLLRAEALKRAQVYQSALTAGWMTPNEVRERENLERLDGLDMVRPATAPMPSFAPNGQTNN